MKIYNNREASLSRGLIMNFKAAEEESFEIYNINTVTDLEGGTDLAQSCQRFQFAILRNEQQ